MGQSNKELAIEDVDVFTDIAHAYYTRDSAYEPKVFGTEKTDVTENEPFSLTTCRPWANSSC